MTPEQRAEKILTFVRDAPLGTTTPKAIEAIAEIIRAAVQDYNGSCYCSVAHSRLARICGGCFGVLEHYDKYERLDQAVEEVAKADCVKCNRAYGRWCEVCATHEANANYRMGRAEAFEEATKILEGDVLKHPDEFTGKEKLKVFDLLERLAATIRAHAKEVS